MKAIAAYIYYLIAQIRRDKGLYNSQTLIYYKKACDKYNTPKFVISHARLQRDLLGYLPLETINSLKVIAPSPKNSLAQRLILESESTTETRAKLAHSPTIEENSTLHEIDQKQTDWRNEFILFLQSKSIAIVGNGTSLNDSSFGGEIDSHSVVCRFNRFSNKGNITNDIGRKIDIWITSADVLNENKALPPNVKWIVISGGNARTTLQNWSGATTYISQNRKIITIPLKLWSFLVQKYEAPPSAGMLWINFLLSLRGLNSDIAVYGFDKNNIDKKNYHIASKSFKASSRHAWKKEKQHLQTLANEKKIDVLHPPIIGTFSRGLSKNQALLRHLGSDKIHLNPKDREATNIDLVIGWGKKENTQKAIKYAKQHNIAYVALEDGFIHSMSQGRLGAKSWSMIIDKTGVFYDAEQPSDLEQCINSLSLTEKQYERAHECLTTILKYKITKYNNTKLSIKDPLAKYCNPILVVDQVSGDTSIACALANKQSFNDMLFAAIKENPNSDILIKTHPDVIAGTRKGCIELNSSLPKNIYVITENLNSLTLLKAAKKVYVVSSQMGLEGLFLNKKVVCFGVPFYSGWGLTDDRNQIDSSGVYNRRIARPDIETLFYAAYINYTSYLDPETLRPCELETVLEYIRLQHHYSRQDKGDIFCLGLTPWKKRFIAHFLGSNDNQVHFITNAKEARKLNCNQTSKILIWSSIHETKAKNIATESSARIIRIEDGFLRSINLGSNYAPPSSLVFDEQGIYFDPNKTSDLELILQNSDFDKKTLLRAKELKNKVITLGVSKYNIGKRVNGSIFSPKQGQKVLLVPGQVSDDASIELGCKDITSNLELLKIVRQNNPNAYIAYKPHPDVLTGNREGHLSDELTKDYCDLVIMNVNISDCLKHADEVHTLTSLVGFEALLRDVKVYCYGLPFYAGWGLTTDRHSISRRTKKLSLDQLIAGTLITYPRYINWSLKSFTSPEYIVEKLHRNLNNKGATLSSNALLHKALLTINLLKAIIFPTFK